MLMYFAPRQSDDFEYRFVDIEPIPLRWRFVDERTNPADDFARSIAVCDDPRCRLAGLLQIVSVDPPHTCTGVIHYGGERLIQLVRNRSRHFSQSGHPRDMRKLCLGLV